ncbi:LysR family transcriptional regulator [Lysobacter sp. A6]|uniref:LysR family transcriptional regulator n=2 Tax=Noviluteimonas lactosilytica TaxID=2888523 RepID=A0ABS8JJF6_9GAMM|nr:LysR family transcriptional regulator [Lysobacter lactosilyticus]MCC8363739.1 LysR family transcriptional regulator [Lysobacter lactosilyticus]
MTLQSRDPDRDLLPTSLSASYAGVVAFLAVATEGSFARAADRLGVGRSAVSRSVQKLEGQLGARLFSRTTRSTSLTAEGEVFYDGCRPGVDRILQAMEEMRDLREGPPRGQLRVSATHGFGRKVIAPLLSRFRERYPEVAVELMLDERAPDLAGERVDVAFREGTLEDSQVVAKQLIPMQMIVCASPSYAAQHGLPSKLEDIDSRCCITLRSANGRLQPWSFKVEGVSTSVTPQGAMTFNDSELALQAVLRGEGIAQLPACLAADAMKAGLLVTALDQYAPDDRGHFLCYLSRKQLPKRIRAFIDFMTTEIRAIDLDTISQWRPVVAEAEAVAEAVAG